MTEGFCASHLASAGEAHMISYTWQKKTPTLPLGVTEVMNEARHLQD
jgi:hypothetical protein